MYRSGVLYGLYDRVGGAARVDVSVVRELKHVLLVRAIAP